MPDPADVFAREARSLVARLRLWTPQRWAASPGDTAPSYQTRADLVHHLAQSFVRAAGETDVPLPRLDSDLALSDQLAVTADDLVRSGRADLLAVAHLLAHRRDVLGEEVPAALVAQLGGVPVQCPDAS
ncbi:MAG: hypothetical protein JWO88_1039 [Frankiales bacterium]|nr:hypothetical protein [Frankiales bacterium]